MRDAVFALADQGLAPLAIAAQLGCARSVAYRYVGEHSKLSGWDWTPERIATLRRIHDAALGVIAEAFGASVPEIKARLVKRATEVELQAMADQDAVVLAAKTAALPATARPRNPVSSSAPARRRYRLVDAMGNFLRSGGKGFTDDPGAAWAGNADEVKAARQRFLDARYCKQREVR